MSLAESLRRSNARFMATINSVLERYNHPFEDDVLISMETLTYSTPDGPKSWEDVSTKDLRKWQEEVLECNRGSQMNAEMSKQHNSDFEDGHSTGHQESPETYCVNTSDTGLFSFPLSLPVMNTIMGQRYNSQGISEMRTYNAATCFLIMKD